MILRTATRFDEKNWFKTEIDKSVPDCEVCGELDGVPVCFTGDVENGLIIGGSLEWNQEIQNGNFAEESNWLFNATGYGSYSVQNNIATIVVGLQAVGDTSAYFRSTNFANVVGHVYMAVIDVNPSVDTSFRYQYPAAAEGTRSKVLTANEWQTYGSVVKGVSNMSSAIFYFNVNNALSENDTILVKNAMVFDLTQMFGSTIADYIYSLEQSQEGAGVALFKALFPADYYEYNAGEEKTITLR